MADWSRPEETLHQFQVFYAAQGYATAAVGEATVNCGATLSPHSAEALRFLPDVVHMDGLWYKVLQDGLRLQFTSLPGTYRESNNQSALKSLTFVRAKVSEWAAEGHVLRLDQPAWCNSPLTVVQKFDPVTDKLKERLVLDMSRHVNKFIADKTVKLDDLTASEHLLDVEDWMTSFDLKNQFFHIKLHPEFYKYFRFSVPDDQGVDRFYCFTVLI